MSRRWRWPPVTAAHGHCGLLMSFLAKLAHVATSATVIEVVFVVQNPQVNELPATLSGADRAFLDRLVGRIKPDDRMNALFLGGSHAGGTADRYSDLDLTLVTTDTGWKAVLADRRQLLKSLGDIVFLEEHDDFGFLLLLFIYGDGVRGELSLTPTRDVGSVVNGPNTTVSTRSVCSTAWSRPD